MAKKLLNRSQIERMLGRRLKRAVTIERSELEIDAEARTAEMSFSSDAAIEHWFGKLILNHAPACIRLDRLRDGGPLLLDHDRTKQIGVHERVDTDGHRLSGVVRFSKVGLGDQIFQDVVDGIRRNASVGLVLYEMHLVSEDDDGPVYQSDDWEPLENSIVAVAADTSIGIGRAREEERECFACDGDCCADCDEDCGGECCDACTPTEREDNSGAAENSGADEERTTQTTTEVRNKTVDEKDIIELGRLYGEQYLELARDMALDGKSIEDVRAAIKAKRQEAQARTTTPAVDPQSAAQRQGGHVQIARATSRLKNFHGERAAETALRFGMFMLAGPMRSKVGDGLLNRAQTFCREHGIVLQRAHSESDNESGGFLVPTEFEAVMIDLRERYGIFRQFSNVVPMSSDSKQRPRRKGGLTARPVGAKGGSRRGTESQKKWDLVELFARKWMVLAKYEDELLEDAVISMADDLAGEIAYAFTIAEDECGFLGDGSGDYHGIVGLEYKFRSLSGNVGEIAGLVQASGNSWDDITRADLLKLIGRLPQYADTENARIFCHKTFWSEVLVRIILEGGGVTAAEIEGSRVKMFQGYRVEIAQVLPKESAASQVACYLGDLAKGSMFGDRRGVTIKLTDSNDTDFEEDLLTIKGTERFDINVHDVGNAAAAAADREAGPVVALITQA